MKVGTNRTGVDVGLPQPASTSKAISGSCSLRVGLLHLAAEAGAIERNRALIEHATTMAAGMGAAWVVSGELVVSGYQFDSLIGTGWITSQPDPWMRGFAELTASLGVVSIVSHPERDEGSGKLFNTLFIIGREGHILGRHQKLHPTPGAEDWSSPGKLGDPVPVDGINVGLLICADAYPPGPALRLRELGAKLLISAAAWWPGDYGPNGEWEARTLDTGLPMIVCNRTGVDGDSQLIDAESVVIDDGRRLATLRSPDSAVFVIECRISGGTIIDCAVVETAYLSAH
jgi:5-aminopentanamidase